jgi:acyl carrier protein
MHTTVQRDVRKFVVDNFLFGQGDGLTDQQSFLEGGIIDSTGVIELVAFIEEKFGISVQDEELVPENLDSIVCVTRFITDKLQAKGERRAS